MKHRGVGREDLRPAAERLGVPLPDTSVDRLLAYEALLLEKAIPFGFIAKSDEPRLRERHVLDSLRAAVEVGDANHLVDLGSGAGLPGIVLAIVAPPLRVDLVESQRRRAAFLELAVERLDLANAAVVAGRAEELPPGTTEVCTARAFAPPARAWEVAEPLLSLGGQLIYFAGAGAGSLEAPPGARIVRTHAPTLESSGPLVIMSR
ncbi:MAG: 16S rRNA (guanine(527)-N(7))-methyltransferase RsmG [Actinomycetota bacterium]